MLRIALQAGDTEGEEIEKWCYGVEVGLIGFESAP